MIDLSKRDFKFAKDAIDITNKSSPKFIDRVLEFNFEGKVNVGMRLTQVDGSVLQVVDVEQDGDFVVAQCRLVSIIK